MRPELCSVTGNGIKKRLSCYGKDCLCVRLVLGGVIAHRGKSSLTGIILHHSGHIAMVRRICKVRSGTVAGEEVISIGNSDNHTVFVAVPILNPVEGYVLSRAANCAVNKDRDGAFHHHILYTADTAYFVNKVVSAHFAVLGAAVIADIAMLAICLVLFLFGGMAFNRIRPTNRAGEAMGALRIIGRSDVLTSTMIADKFGFYRNIRSGHNEGVVFNGNRGTASIGNGQSFQLIAFSGSNIQINGHTIAHVRPVNSNDAVLRFVYNNIVAMSDFAGNNFVAPSLTAIIGILNRPPVAIRTRITSPSIIALKSPVV